MNKRLYVKNLPFAVDDHRLQEKFSEVGPVTSAKVIVNRDTNRSQGYGFVEMQSHEDAEKAISDLNGRDFDGRSISVDFARPRENSPRPGGRGDFQSRSPRQPRAGGGNE